MIVAVATDVGAWRVVRPVLRELERRRVVVKIVLAEPAATYAARDGVDHEPLPSASLDDRAVDDRADAILGRLLRSGPTALLLGTSPSEVIERTLARRARGRVPTVGVVDALLFVERRFGPGLRDLPDVVACPDQATADRLRAAGAAPERLVVTGNPTLEEIGRVVAEWGMGQPPLLSVPPTAAPADVLFVSQQVRDAGRPEAPFALDERRSLEDVLAGLDASAAGRPDSFRVRVRPHPAQRPDRLPASSRTTRVELDEDPDRLRSAARARLVVGISSSLLIEARMVARPAVAYLPGAYWDRVAAFAPDYGVWRARSALDLRMIVEQLLAATPGPPPDGHVGAAGRVADLVAAMRARRP